MGRKPNALILAHFERGAKLNDSSNRYQHTCKACGEKFPKGRIDSLTGHLVKKCPAITLRDRQKALLELNNLPDLADGEAAQQQQQHEQQLQQLQQLQRAQNGEVQMNGPTVELPIGNRDWTALETLAEVSRQIDLSEKHDDRSVNNRSVGAHSATSETPRNERLELHEQYTLDNPPLSYEQRVQRDKRGLNTRQNRRSTSLTPGGFAAQMTNSRSASPNLAMAASSIAAAAAAARFIPSMVDPQLLGEDAQAQAQAQEAIADAKPLKEEPAEVSAAMNANTAAAITEQFFGAGSGESQSTWPMLGESGENMYPDPESFEHNLENTDMNRGDMVRAGSYPRLAMNPTMTTEFTAEYGNGQRPNKPKVRGRFSAERRKEVQEVRKRGACIRCRMLKKPCSGGNPCNTCRNVESARLWKTPCIRTRIADELDMYSAGLHAVLAYHQVNSTKSQACFRISPSQIVTSHYPDTGVYATFQCLEGIDGPAENNIDPGLANSYSTGTVRILDNDNDDLPMKLEAYMRRMSPMFFAQEPSNFMNVTLNTARDLSIEKQDALLTRVLELWATVHILVDHELHWSISEKTDIDAQPGDGRSIDPHSGDGTFALICLQLNAAAEKKAGQICKSVLIDLEKRLLQRTTTSSFETFLVTLILLNCVEKSTWLFKSWEQDGFKERWPLDRSPHWYSGQGDRITDTLHMLLRMRSVAPKTYTRAEDGVLATDADQIAKIYFEKLNLTYAEVIDKQTKNTFDAANPRCYELRFCSKVLLYSP